MNHRYTTLFEISTKFIASLRLSATPTPPILYSFLLIGDSRDLVLEHQKLASKILEEIGESERESGTSRRRREELGGPGICKLEG